MNFDFQSSSKDNYECSGGSLSFLAAVAVTMTNRIQKTCLTVFMLPAERFIQMIVLQPVR